MIFGLVAVVVGGVGVVLDVIALAYVLGSRSNRDTA